MKQLIRFNWTYFTLTVFFLVIEIIIALYVHDKIIRPYIGDILVVFLMYCFIKTLLNTPYFMTALSVLIFSFAIEALQYFKIVELLDLQDSVMARTILGTSFEWIDIVAYTIGFAIIIFIEKNRTNKYPD